MSPRGRARRVADRTVPAPRMADHGLAMHPPRDELELMRDVDRD